MPSSKKSKTSQKQRRAAAKGAGRTKTATKSVSKKQAAARTRPRIVAVVQARMGSSRLPGKTMEDLAGTPLLDRVIRQVRAARTIDEVVIATSVDRADDV